MFDVKQFADVQKNIDVKKLLTSKKLLIKIWIDQKFLFGKAAASEFTTPTCKINLETKTYSCARACSQTLNSQFPADENCELKFCLRARAHLQGPKVFWSDSDAAAGSAATAAVTAAAGAAAIVETKSSSSSSSCSS